MIVTITIDTEEDNWGSYAATGATTENIGHLLELQELFERYGARPTYLVNLSPLLSRSSVEVLGALAERGGVEIGAHCHPWNTPPYPTGSGGKSMMCDLSRDANRAKLRTVSQRLQAELGVAPRSFRAGRWGFGPTVAAALVDEGYEIDCSVSPLIDWSSIGGPDFSAAPRLPYRFEPATPLQPVSRGSMLELPTTVGFLRGGMRRSQDVRRWLEASTLARYKIVGLLDRSGLIARRWLSPEVSTGREMIQLGKRAHSRGEPYLSLTFHSCALLPGATPFVRDGRDRARFIAVIERFLRYCRDTGFAFRTLNEAAGEIALPVT